MEDIVDVYQRPYDPKRPLVCVDETSKQLIAETRVPIAAKPGQPARHDYEYRRNGTANLFMMFAPLEGWRRVKVTDRHTALDYAQVLKELSDSHFPGGENCARPGQPEHAQAQLRFMKPFPPPMHAASSNGSSGITRPNMEVGWTWPNLNWVSCRPNVSTGAFQISGC
jgi:hypothetical protein